MGRGRRAARAASGSTRSTSPPVPARFGPTCPASTTRWSTACRRSTTRPGSRPRCASATGTPAWWSSAAATSGSRWPRPSSSAALDVTLVEAAAQVMPPLDADVAAPLVGALEGLGIDVRLDTAARRRSRTGRCVAGGERIPADVVVLGLGRRAERRPGGRRRHRRRGARARSASTAGSARRPTACGPPATAASRTTSWPGVPVHIALGTVANKQGRVAGINIAGGYATFPGVARHRRHEGLQHRDRAHRACRRAECERLRLRGRRGERRGRRRGPATCPSASQITVKALAEVGTGRMLGGADRRARRAPPSASTCWPPPSRPGMTADEVVDARPRLRPAVRPGLGPGAPGGARAADRARRARNLTEPERITSHGTKQSGPVRETSSRQSVANLSELGKGQRHGTGFRQHRVGADVAPRSCCS